MTLALALLVNVCCIPHAVYCCVYVMTLLHVVSILLHVNCCY